MSNVVSLNKGQLTFQTRKLYVFIYIFICLELCKSIFTEYNEYKDQENKVKLVDSILAQLILAWGETVTQGEQVWVTAHNGNYDGNRVWSGNWRVMRYFHSTWHLTYHLSAQRVRCGKIWQTKYASLSFQLHCNLSSQLQRTVIQLVHNRWALDGLVKII